MEEGFKAQKNLFYELQNKFESLEEGEFDEFERFEIFLRENHPDMFYTDFVDRTLPEENKIDW